ncbi:triphosphoribosyl-dephospho-CoA synthase MdcB [Spartobacteria bacterium LR76]|nr:triphosphoribosyl-dephospho-CoA synthase MdcB [Spartobacteria bacterium LR76]
MTSFAEEIARCAANALREELETYPKPGLVSMVDQGSHPDMDAQCFLASIEAITPGFAEMADCAGGSLHDLQRIGVEMEEAMQNATSGRNAHRGAIFCLGLLCAAAGERRESAEPLGEIVARRWGAGIPQPDFLDVTSDGIAMCRRYQMGGVRREAALGFPSVYQIGLPAYREALPYGRAAARVQAFFAILEHCEDTTLLKRGGPEGRDFARQCARRFLDCGGVAAPDWWQRAQETHHEFVRRNLTAGGVADLLAATLFVEDMERRP